MGEQIAAANLTDWRKLAQGLHARYVVDDFGAGARFVVAVGEAGDALGHYPRVSIGNGYVDLKLISDAAIYRDDGGAEHVVEWVTQQDVDLARRITEIAADHKIDAEPASVSHFRDLHAVHVEESSSRPNRADHRPASPESAVQPPDGGAGRPHKKAVWRGFSLARESVRTLCSDPRNDVRGSHLDPACRWH